ncbi:pentatricopeptide repeat-containing protein At2g45350, chloroplastic [Brachypodium distachyon]|uniref:pentatricopeptide repeat-containing protein At2g45350, chloroplastic n=1 Tax=Brachypodium distachyon TaxID=15368 RepID=UPI000D0D47C3|nr:pentatricopeptide repeat-containing protein At2g45350, chloroplastic [Brachypodium distachyon]|eukprot:XP_024317219.1 pentatricopeptide repeat-containing protein At2g45350, chloroplastic [Brachypodium distachyon]
MEWLRLTCCRSSSAVSSSPATSAAAPRTSAASLYFPLFPSSCTFLHNLLIRASATSPSPRLAFAAFSSILRSGDTPDRFTFPSLLKSASRLASFPRTGAQVHAQAVRRGLLVDVFVVNTLLAMYAAFRDTRSMREVFDSCAGVADLVTWNTMLGGYVKCGEIGEARRVFEQMPQRNGVSWSAMVGAYAGAGELDVAREMFDEMPAIGRNVVSWNSMITGFARHGLLPLARKMFDEMPVRNLVSWNTMVRGYAVNGEMNDARELFDRMPEKDVVSWTCMISGYAQARCYTETLELFRAMQSESNVLPNEVTMVSVLSACAHLTALEEGRWAHAFIDKHKMVLDSEFNLGAALIDMYSKCGRTDLAVKIFHSLDQKNVSAWNALITGLAVNGDVRSSIDVFEQMRRSGEKPNGITFVGVLTACAHGGLVDEGRRCFQSMASTCGVQPEAKHYGCMVDMLGRAGLLEEAEELIRSMPMVPDVMILGALLGACRMHKRVDVAARVQNEILGLSTQQSGCHVLISDIYAAAGKWADALYARGVLQKFGINK